jgi:hypothetical protein
MAYNADTCKMESKITSKSSTKKTERERTEKRTEQKGKEKKLAGINYCIYVEHTFSNRKGHSNNSIGSWNTIQTTYEI